MFVVTVVVPCKLAGREQGIGGTYFIFRVEDADSMPLCKSISRYNPED
jgi:hypothetical protein